MKKINYIIAFIAVLFNYTYSQQNLVPNPSFESYTACPSSLGEIYKATSWDFYNGSPDYFNACSTFPSVDVPSNSFGYQLPSSGNSYAGLITYYNNSLAREIIGVNLTTPLVTLQKYYVSFMVNRGSDNSIVGYSTNKIGVKLTNTKSYSVAINNSAHYYSNLIITDTLNWIKVFGSFIADSAYQYLMIGNFFDDSNTTITNQSSGIYAYYFIDDVCLSTDSSYVINYITNVKENTITDEIQIEPNPANSYFKIKTNNGQLEIFNAFGNKMIYETTEVNGFIYFNCYDWPVGLYYIKIRNKIKKIIINH